MTNDMRCRIDTRAVCTTGAARPASIRRGPIAGVVAGLLAANLAAQNQTDQQPPRFRSSVELTSIDVAVVDNQGRPVAGLMPGDFTVRIDGKPRGVVSAEWVPLASEPANPKPATRVPEGYSSNENATGGRLIAIVVDEPHIRPGGAAAVLAAASAFIDRLSPNDRVAAVSLGMGGPVTPFTADRKRVKDAIARMSGQRETLKLTNQNVTPNEAFEIVDGNRLTTESVYARECAGLRNGSAAMMQCRQEVDAEASTLAEQLRRSSDLTIRGLREVLEALKPLDGPKTMILMSEGFAFRDASFNTELGALAAETRTSIYALKLENQLFDITNSKAAPAIDAATVIRNDGLESVAAASRGTLFLVNGTGSQLFAHIESELSGYYLLGVESDPGDRDRKSRVIRIDVTRRGATVRTRRQLLNVSSEVNRPRNVREAIAASLTAPLLASALPVRVTAFALRGPEQGKVQLLIRAEVGNDYTGPKPGLIGYVIMDRDGKSVETRTVNAVLTPVMNGVPGALQYSAGASVDPGEYTIKLAVAEGDRLGSVEHPIHAGLLDAGDVSLSDLMVGGPVDSSDLLRPTVGYTVSYGSLHGYMEAYGARLDRLAATYEVAVDAEGPALLSSDVKHRDAGGDRTLFSQVLPVSKLPPGEYVLRAKLTSSGTPVKTLTRRFEIAPPAVLMTSASGASIPPASVDLFLPVDEASLSRPFARDEALKAQNLDPFVQRVPAGTKPAFEAGLAEYRKSNYTGAATQFKKAIRPDVDSTAAMTYLGASLAAAGASAEAASVWQTALVDGSDLPQIYEWLAETLMRTKDFSGAQSILEEAIGKWPGDSRFSRMLAFSYATLGKGREASRALDRYISDGHADPDLLYLGVEWLYQIHSNHAVVVSQAADLALARGYAAQYTKAGGPRQALVQQWLDFLEHEKR
jgi:VWFA-related protein